MKTIPLTQGQVALVHDCDYGFLMRWRWFALALGGGFRAVRRRQPSDGPGPDLIAMHEVIYGRALSDPAHPLREGGLTEGGALRTLGGRPRCGRRPRGARLLDKRRSARGCGVASAPRRWTSSAGRASAAPSWRPSLRRRERGRD
jgi:hypothetical protein